MDDPSNSARGGYRRASDETWALARRDYQAGHTGEEVCARYDLRPGTLRDRARAEGWRRMDAPDLEPVDLNGDELLELPDYEEMALVALVRVNRALTTGRAAEAGAWMRLHEKLTALAALPDHDPDPEPAPPPRPGFVVDHSNLAARQAAINARFAEMAAEEEARAARNSDNSDTFFFGPGCEPLPPRPGEGGRREATAGWGGPGDGSADAPRLFGQSGAASPAPPPPASPSAQPPPRGGEGKSITAATPATPPRSPPPAAP